MLYDADSYKIFRRILIFKLNLLKDAFISDEKELKNLLEWESCKNAMYKMSRKIERQLQYIENNNMKFEFGLKDYNKVLERFWDYVLDFDNIVSSVEGEILEELWQYKDFKKYVFEKCILGY